MTGKLATLTPEQRQEISRKGLAARRQKAADRAASPLRRDFSAENHWLELARRFKVELAPWGEAPTPKNVEKYLNRYGLTQREYLDWYGQGSMASFEMFNPIWPMRALCGILLEAIAEGQIVSRTLAPS